MFAMSAVMVTIFAIMLIVLAITEGEHAETTMPLATIGIPMLIVVPFIYGSVGFIIYAIYAAVYNLIASFLGGLKIELEPVKAEKG